MTKSIIVFIPLAQDSKFEMWSLRMAQEFASSGKKTLFFEADRKSSILHRFKKLGCKGDIISVLKRENTLNQIVQKTPAAPKLSIIWGNTSGKDISVLNDADMSVMASDLAIMMNDYDCTIIKCSTFDLANLTPCFEENTKIVLLITPNPDCAENVVKIAGIVKKASYIPQIWLKIIGKEYPSQDLRIFQQLKNAVGLSEFNFFQSENDSINQKLLQSSEQTTA